MFNPPPLRLAHPEPPRGHPRLIPVFLPFAGCRERCAYCAQHLSAAGGAPAAGLDTALDRLGRDLEALRAQGGPACELGFFGGTFTRLPEDWTWRFLGLAGRFLANGTLSRVRCSTRPDAVDPGLLARLRDAGLGLVELGVQSFDDAVLEQSGRGYPGARAREACALVRSAGLGLGLQLLPGLPGQAPDPDGSWGRDLAAALACAPDLARLYPCLVLEGTALARRWAAGDYAPWPLDRTVDLLGRALLAFWERGIPVIRMGLAPEPGLEAHVLAGPRHPALGQMARSRALFHYLAPPIRNLGRPPRQLLAPRRHLSDVLGHAREMLPAWAGLGLGPAALGAGPDEFFHLG
jgi:histone acetyltransferase (RNA polymerase elongator complex component)